MLLRSRTKEDGTQNISRGGREFVAINLVPCTREAPNASPSRSPGIRFGYTGQMVGITLGTWTSNGTLVAYRIDGLDWMFTNVTTGTHLLVTPITVGSEKTDPAKASTFELRVTNWAYGVQIDAVRVAAGEKLVKLRDYPRRVEVIGDSLAAGMYTSFEGLSSWA